MKHGIAVGISLLVASVMLLAPLAGADQTFRTERAPAVGFLGVLTISPSCALSDASAPVTQSGTTFTLTGTLYGSLVVLCPGATVNGAGYTLNYSALPLGNPGVALTVNSSLGVTVENLLFTNVTYGIVSNSSPDLTLQGDKIPGATETAIEVLNSREVAITNNLFNSSGYYGIYLNNVSSAAITDNNGTGSTYGIEADYSQGLSVDRNNDSFGEYGVGFYYTNNSTVSDGQQFEDAYPLWVDYGHQDSFVGNDANASTYYGIYYDGATDVTASDNYVVGSTEYASDVEDSSGVTEQGNNGRDSTEGFYSEYSSDLTYSDDNASFGGIGFEGYYTTAETFEGDQAVGETEYAFDLDYTTNVLISNNHAPDSEYGVYDEYDNGTTVVGNDFTNSTDSALYSDEASSNLVVEQNDLANSSDEGVYADAPYGAVTIADNDLAGSHDEGVDVYGSYGQLTVTDNDLVDAADYGVYVEDCYATVTITGNDIAHSGSEDGIYAYETYGTTVIAGNNVSNAHDTGIELEYVYGVTNVTGNDATNATSDGIYAYGSYGPLGIIGNDLAHSSTYGIYAYYTYGPVNITGNDVADSAYGIYEYEPYGPSYILDNDVLDSTETGIEVEYAYEYGGVLIQGNNASHSEGDSLYYYDNEFPSSIIGNDFSNSVLAYIGDSEYTSIVGNNFLNDRGILVDVYDITAFDHNDINTTAFDAAGSTIEFGSGKMWNAQYPVGGNYWTGYSGKDLYSGPYQNISGSDGIGDTPEPVSSAGSSAIDEYPLTHPWTTSSSTIRFTSTGLPAASAWSVRLSFEGFGSGTRIGYGSGSSPITILTSYAAATPFTYVVAPLSGYVAAPGSGSGTTGTGVTTVAIAFTAFEYTVSFKVTGISAGTSWTLSVGGSNYPTTNAQSNVSLANGTYPWRASSDGGAATVSGTVVVNGANESVTVAFSSKIALPPGLFAVVFVQVGLSNGATWSVTFNGSTQTSSGTTIIFSAENGTHSYSVTTTGTASPKTASGTVTVSGSATAVSVLFGSATAATVNNTVSTGPSWTELYAALGIAALLGILAAIGWIRSGRKGGSQPTPAGPPASWSSSPSPPPAGAMGGPGPTGSPTSPPPPPPST